MAKMKKKRPKPKPETKVIGLWVKSAWSETEEKITRRDFYRGTALRSLFWAGLTFDGECFTGTDRQLAELRTLVDKIADAMLKDETA